MAQQLGPTDASQPRVPEKCARCRYLHKESDHMLAITQVNYYCRAPLWHPKRWTCRRPSGIDRA